MKSITSNPRRGDIYDCIFGNYLPIESGSGDITAYDYRIPNEMRKRRPVVILGERNKQLLVAPISSTKDTHKQGHRTGEALGLHIKMRGNEIPEAGIYIQNIDRWIKADLIQSVDIKRLREFRLRDGTHVKGVISRETLMELQLAVIRFLGFSQKIHHIESILNPNTEMQGVWRD